ncbi:hypothetical protein L596_008107 [Steinernema carpocapsae]|uniref:Uncharacterized protein n=1 Tax=Steinernema carpocapsae TaxID=34508 RepID=A0A4U5PBF5_STECR|nr:hypothetical protein L596_008107 [Steinernema carpocapsae]
MTSAASSPFAASTHESRFERLRTKAATRSKVKKANLSVFGKDQNFGDLIVSLKDVVSWLRKVEILNGDKKLKVVLRIGSFQ